MGDPDAIEREVGGRAHSRIPMLPASEVIEMLEHLRRRLAVTPVAPAPDEASIS